MLDVVFCLLTDGSLFGLARLHAETLCSEFLVCVCVWGGGWGWGGGVGVCVCRDSFLLQCFFTDEDLQAVLDLFVAALGELGDLSPTINICKTEVL